jgi:hypothetical protein
MTLPTIGEGFGSTYTKPTQTIPRESGRSETVVQAIVGGRRVTVVRRTDITPEDPYVVLAKGAAYSISTGAPFPVPRVRRNIKDHLIRLNITI